MAEPIKKLYRLPKEGVVTGVAAGFAQYLAMDVTLMRLIFVAIILLSGGAALIAYIVLAIVMPTPDDDNAVQPDLGQKIENLAHEVKEGGRAGRIANLFGIGLIALGAWLLIGQFLPSWFNWQWDLIWPGLIIVLGVWILMRSKKS